MKIDLSLGYTQLLITTCQDKNLLRNEVAYVLGTSWWETAHTMKPVREGYWLPNAENWRKNHLRYYPWYGRGFVQLTWEPNYKRASDEIGVDLIANPDLALEPNNAAKIAVTGMIEGWFTGKKLSDYIDLQHSDFKGARHIINGNDKDEEIAAVAAAYDDALRGVIA